MKEEKNSASGKALGIVFFLVGFVGAMVVGWVVFPNLLFSQKAQPINFSHVAHQDNDCESCHKFRADGSYTGIPRIDNCKECHETAQGTTEAERILVEEYVAKDKELPWKVYAWQPDNVFFSHAPHKGQGLECTSCHRDVKKEEKLPPYRENRITGYSISTMTMRECEDCHASKGASNNCEICHK
ncbi:MAG: menaquinone reductase multiheme cytochrome c subunit QrcA [Syntrophobacteraceae bacterium]